MAEVTVKQLAEVVGVPVKKLLNQLQEAGLAFTEDSKEQEMVSDDQKRTLLQFLKANHGRTEGPTPERITLKRRSVSKVKLGSDMQRSAKTVNVEVRKKRTFVKRSVLLEQQSQENSQEELLEDTSDALVEVDDSDASTTVTTAETAVAVEAGVEVISDVENEATPAAPIEEALSSDTLDESQAPVEEVHAIVEEIPLVVEPPVVEAKPAAPVSEDKKSSHKAKKAKRHTGSDSVNTRDKHKKKSAKKTKRHERSNARHMKGKAVRDAEIALTQTFEKPSEPIVHEVAIPETLTVGELAKRMSVKATEVIKVMMGLGAMATINQVIDQDTAVIVVEEMGHKPKVMKASATEEMLDTSVKEGSEVISRAPVVTIMGHVDHGKTSLLDYIRQTKVAAGEAGGITQHIGAYHVKTDKGSITFLDTPGHAAFTAMRARGAKATDIVILIVAADDGVKPQTVEAVQHAKAAEVPIIVAINKIDKPEADLDRVKNELSALDVIPEDWGGDIMFIPISAKSGEGIDSLLDSILLQAEVLELTATADGAAKGVVIESRLDKGRGPVATILIQNGTLHKGDILLAGLQYGKIKALSNDAGKVVEHAGPSIPIEVLGLSGVPHAGDDSVVVNDERKAREIALFRQGKYRDVKLSRKQKSSLEGIFDNLSTNESKTLNLMLKADVQGSVEALVDALTKLSSEEIKVEVIASGVGGITASDIHLAVASSAVVIGFNVRADGSAKKLAEQEEIQLHYYSVIYDVVDQIKLAMTGMLSPEYKESIVGTAEVRDVFRSPKLGAIAGCMVIDGMIKRNNPIRVLRDHVVIYEGTLESVRRFKDDVLEVRQGFECGIGVKNYNDVKVGDQIEVYETIEVKRSL